MGIRHEVEYWLRISFTQNVGNYPQVVFNGGLDSDIFSTSETIGTLYGPINAGRLPYYHRLDLNIKRIFYLSEKTTLEANLSVTNVYNRKTYSIRTELQSKAYINFQLCLALEYLLNFNG